MNVLFVIHGPVFGGAHNQALRLAAPLARRGFQTIVVLPRERGNAAERLRSGGVEVVEIPLHRVRATRDPRTQLVFASAFAPDVLRLRRIIRERAIDLVQIGGLVNPHAAIAARLSRVPVVWQLLDTTAPPLVAWSAMLFVRALADVVMPTGVAVLKSFPGARHVRSRLVPFIPPVDTAVFRPRPALRSAVRREWGVDESALVVGCVANLNPQKGHPTLIEAFRGIRAELPSAHLVLVGSEHESHPSYAANVHALVASAGLVEGRDVTFVGARHDIERQMQGFDIAALAAVPRSEGIPTVLLEAMACGVPVVATDVGGVSEAIVEGVTGRIVPPFDAEAFASAALPILTSEGTRASMGVAGRRRAEEFFSLERCAETHERAYRAAVDRTRAGRGGGGVRPGTAVQ